MTNRLATFLIAAVTLAACQGSTDSGSPTGGAGGTSTTGGAGGRGGSGGSAGRGGSGGATGGSTGTGGSSGGTGGSASTGGSGGGTGGSGPGGGSGGAAGGNAGTGGGGGASGGTGGSSGGTGGSGAGGTGGSSGGDAGVKDATMTGEAPGSAEKFSFFYTSLDAVRRLSKSQNGFGGDLRFGAATGIEGADKICQTIATDVGFGSKTWRAFLSATKGADGQPVHAINRVGEGPWYDRRGRLISMNKAGLISGTRPAGDPAAVNDLPDETGQGTKRLGDTHDVITGTNRQGMLVSTDPVRSCMDWTSVSGRGPVQMGHAWPAGSGQHWIVAHTEGSCAAGVNLVQNGPGNGSSIGSGGGWGGFYCFALQP
jgi:hypothetical protein